MDEREVIRHFDTTTGAELEESAERVQQQDLADARAECALATELFNSQGYTWLQGMLSGKVDTMVSQLIECEVPCEITRLQEAIKAYKSIVSLVEEKVYLGQQLAAEDSHP